MKIGRRIYFDVLNGNPLVDTGERQGGVVPTTPKEDALAYKELSERVIGTYAYIELAFGQFSQDFRESTGYRINIDKIADLPFEEGYKAIEFSYPDPNEPEEEQSYRAPLSAEVERLKQEDLNNKEAIAELYILSTGGF